MKNVSSAFREQLNNDNRDYIKSADVTLKDGTVLHVDNSDMWNNGLTIEDATSNTNSFDIGAVIIGSATLVLNNIYDEYTEYDFTDCVMSNVKVGLELPDETIESLQYGKYYLDEAKYNGSIITLNFFDGISKFDKDYSESNLIYPATLLQIVQDACTVCGIALGTPSFDNDDYVVETRPVSDSLTFRQVLAWVAQISCNYCKCDEQGRLCLEWYDIETLENMALYTEETPLGDLSGSDILDHESQQIITIIEQESANSNTLTSGIGQYQTLNSNVSLSTGLDDVVITGIKVVQEIEGDEGTETVVYQSGTDGYVLSIEGNKLIQGDNGDLVSDMIAIKTVGIRFRTFEASTFSDPTIEAGDVALLIDRKGKRYKSLITNNRFTPGNFQTISCGAESPARKSASRYSQITQVYVDYRKELEKERTDREEALDELSERMDNSSGLFTTEEIQPDGSTIFYMHDKPLLSESQIIWRMTAEAWGVSTDGGKSYNAGMTVDGDTIVRILTATGINANWINSGAISIEDQDGNETFYADTETGQVRISANSFSLQGQSITEIAGEEIDDFVDSVYTPQINNLQAQIDGKIETWYYDYQPTLSNIPASQWTTNEERQKHIGDLFYWQSKGFTYRFQQSGSTYIWQAIQDSDITEALAQAATAQDIADSKRRVFVSTPTPPYDVGDLWTQGSNGDIMRCTTARQTGSYVSTDWGKASKYTDDTAVDELNESLDQSGIFNRLTNNGQTQGIYLQDGLLYINSEYIRGDVIEGIILQSVDQRIVINPNNEEEVIHAKYSDGREMFTIGKYGIDMQKWKSGYALRIRMYDENGEDYTEISPSDISYRYTYTNASSGSSEIRTGYFLKEIITAGVSVPSHTTLTLNLFDLVEYTGSGSKGHILILEGPSNSITTGTTSQDNMGDWNWRYLSGWQTAEVRNNGSYPLALTVVNIR